MEIADEFSDIDFGLAKAEMLVALDAFLDRYPLMALQEPPAMCGGSIRGPREVRVRLGPQVDAQSVLS